MLMPDGAQVITNCTKTEIDGLPGRYVYQDSGANAWMKSYDDGSILLGPLVDGDLWTVFLEPEAPSE